MERDEMDREKIRQETCECNKDVTGCQTDHKQAEECCGKNQGCNTSAADVGNEHNIDGNEGEMVEKLKKDLDIAQKKCDEYLSLAQRIQADFDNYKRRNRTAVSDAYGSATLETVEVFLPVLDNLERALESAGNSTSDEGKAICKGVEMVVKQFRDILEKLDIEEIEALNQPFDPIYHNAVMQAEAEGEEQQNIVVEVLQKGYKQRDKVIRYSMVKVAN